MGRVGEAWRINGDGWRPDSGSEHTVQCTDDVLWDCVPEPCIIVLTRVTPIHSVKRGKNKQECLKRDRNYSRHQGSPHILVLLPLEHVVGLHFLAL